MTEINLYINIAACVGSAYICIMFLWWWWKLRKSRSWLRPLFLAIAIAKASTIHLFIEHADIGVTSRLEMLVAIVIMVCVTAHYVRLEMARR